MYGIALCITIGKRGRTSTGASREKQRIRWYFGHERFRQIVIGICVRLRLNPFE